MAIGSGLVLYASFKPVTLKESQPGLYKAGRDLLGRINSNWSSTRGVKATARLGPGKYTISVGTTGRSHLYAHLIEFGGGRHRVQAPTRRAIDAAGMKVVWGGSD